MERDPFKLIEENGYFYGRGTGDNKAGLTGVVTSLLKLKAAGKAMTELRRKAASSVTTGVDRNAFRSFAPRSSRGPRARRARVS